MARVKICGINSPAAIDAAVEAGADWIGFVFFPPSPRYVSPATAADLAARQPNGPPRVGLFVNPEEALIAEALAAVHLDVLQLYGAGGRLAFFRERFGLPVWHAAGVAVAADLPLDMRGADALVIEAKAPPNAIHPGGNAVSFDWTLTRHWPSPGPWLLAGGLDAGNVAEAVKQSGAPGVDVSSGVERAKGVKDPALVHAFVTAAKAV